MRRIVVGHRPSVVNVVKRECRRPKARDRRLPVKKKKIQRAPSGASFKVHRLGPAKRRLRNGCPRSGGHSRKIRATNSAGVVVQISALRGTYENGAAGGK